VKWPASECHLQKKVASPEYLVQERPSTVVATGRLAVDLDEGQYERGHGPCLHAAATRETAEIRDTRSETRWPDHARRAAEHGNLSSLSVPLVIDDPQVSGALNIYAGNRTPSTRPAGRPPPGSRPTPRSPPGTCTSTDAP
jgi:GAF domain-containing protein